MIIQPIAICITGSEEAGDDGLCRQSFRATASGIAAIRTAYRLYFNIPENVMPRSYRLLLLGIVFLCPAATVSADDRQTVSLTSALVRHAHVTETQAEEQVQQFFGIIREELRKGKAVEIENFGKFYLSERTWVSKSRDARGSVPPKTVTRRYPRFTASPTLKAEMNP
jgi:nucleoid DNA-binding protein